VSTASEFQPVQKSRLYEKVAAQIRRRIIDGDLQPGDRLPSEYALAKEFGVSRTVVREAMQSLRDQQLVIVKQGIGTVVDAPSSDSLGEALSTILQFRGASAYDLHEIRQILEIEVAGLAAERATEEDLVQLRKALKWMETVEHSPEKYTEVDLLFHTVLAKATKNEIFLVLLEPLIDLLRKSRLQSAVVPGAVQRSFAAHRLIYDCVRRGDVEAAQEAMEEHLREVGERLTVAGVESLS